MAKKKYYAVRAGKVPGIYDSWDECKRMIDGYSNAEYKAFAIKEDAISFLNGDSKGETPKEIAKAIDSVIAYVDGSYSESMKKYSYGCILILPNGEMLRKSGAGDDPKALAVRNIAGELLGAMYAVKTASELGYKSVVIRHDYIGISKWFTKEWRAKDEIAKKYLQYLSKMQNKIDITFEKVVAHSGDKYNEEADLLAKSALESVDKVTTEYCKVNNHEIEREEIVRKVNELIMDSSEVIDFLGITSQKLTAMNKGGKLVSIKKGIYLRSDVENLK